MEALALVTVIGLCYVLWEWR